MPTTAIITYGANRLEPLMDPENADAMAITMAHVAANIARGTILGQVTASKDYAVYNSTLTNGAGSARVILMYDIQVDANGLITLSSTASQVGGDLGQNRLDVPAYIKGIFDCNELVGLDANAVTQLGGHLLYGTVANGALAF